MIQKLIIRIHPPRIHHQHIVFGGEFQILGHQAQFFAALNGGRIESVGGSGDVVNIVPITVAQVGIGLQSLETEDRFEIISQLEFDLLIKGAPRAITTCCVPVIVPLPVSTYRKAVGLQIFAKSKPVASGSVSIPPTVQTGIARSVGAKDFLSIGIEFLSRVEELGSSILSRSLPDRETDEQGNTPKKKGLES